MSFLEKIPLSDFLFLSRKYYEKQKEIILRNRRKRNKEMVKIKNRKICMRNVKQMQGDKGENIEIKFVINKINCRKHYKFCKYKN